MVFRASGNARPVSVFIIIKDLHEEAAPLHGTELAPEIRKYFENPSEIFKILRIALLAESDSFVDSTSDLFLLFLFEKGLDKKNWAQRIRAKNNHQVRQLLPDDNHWAILKKYLVKLVSCKYATTQLDSLFTKLGYENRDLPALDSRFKNMLRKAYNFLSSYKPTVVCPLSPTMMLAIHRSLPAGYDDPLLNAYKVYIAVMFNGFRGYEVLASSEVDWDKDHHPFFLKDLTFLIETKGGGTRQISWGEENWDSPIRDEWLDALDCDGLVFAIIGTKHLKNDKFVQVRQFAIAIDVPPEFNLLFLLKKNLKCLRSLGYKITGFTPICSFIVRSGKVAPLTSHAMTEFLSKINEEFELKIPIHSHDFKRGIGSAAAENEVNPAVLSEILHHKNTLVDGSNWSAGTYIQKFTLVNKAQKEIALRVIRRYEAFCAG